MLWSPPRVVKQVSESAGVDDGGDAYCVPWDVTCGEITNGRFRQSGCAPSLSRRYAEEGIVIPFPIRAINTDQENAHLSQGTADATAARG